MRAVLTLALLILALPALALDPGALHLVTGSFTEADLDRLAPPEVDDGLWVMHFEGRIGESERGMLESAGLTILGYLPVNNLLVRGDVGAREGGLPGVEFAHPYRPEWRRDPALDGRGGRVLEMSAMLLPGESASRFADRATARGAQILRVVEMAESPRVFLRAGASRVADLTTLPGLRWLSEVGEAQDRLDFVRWIVQSAEVDLTPVWDLGLDGEGQILGHIDSGFQLETCHFHDPDAYPVGPDHRKVVYIDPQNVFSSHGLHTASILAGDIEPLYGWTTNRGQAFRSRFATSRYNVTGFSLYETLGIHHSHGSRLHTNSWGQDQYTHYTQHCHDIDKFSHENEEDMVAFAVTNTSTLRSPENAKNVLAVGATMNATEEDLDFFEEHGYGGTGPTIDGRRKPEIYAPGRTVWAAAQSYTSNPEDWPNFCRGRGAGGTSMACPSIVSVASLMREYFMEGWYPSGAPMAEDAFTPSGALMRATLINSTHDLLGVSGYPSDREGWGRIQMNLGMKLGEDSPIDQYLQDFRHTEGLNTGQERIYTFAVGDDSLDLKVTMAFSDYPAEVSANPAVVNDLDLHLTSPSGQEYWGNWFSDGYSVPGGERDPLNSVERVVVTDPDTGVWTLRVIGENVPMGPQGFAFIVSGQLTESDVIPPELSLDMSVEERSVHLLLEASEILDPEMVDMNLFADAWGIILEVNEVAGSDGLQWESEYLYEHGAADFSVQACGSDLAGNQTCIFDNIGLHPIGIGESPYLISVDGLLGLDFEAGSLDEYPLLGLVQLDAEPDLAVYQIMPAIEMTQDAIIEWDYGDLVFPDGMGPENLQVFSDSRVQLLSFYDEERQKLICRSSGLSVLRFALDNGAGSSAIDANFVELSQGFPNPFHAGEGLIEFSLELRDTHRIKAEIFDARGRRLNTLDHEWALPGGNTLRWNGRNSEGELLANGVYFLRLEVNGESLSRKVVVIH